MIEQLRIKEADFEISMQRGFECGVATVTTSPNLVASTPIAQAQTIATPVLVTSGEGSLLSSDTINAPMVGTYYSSPSPESPAFVKVGDVVRKGQTLCILEAMKIMNEVEAEFDCKILEILVQDASPVEYDMPLFVVEKI